MKRPIPGYLLATVSLIFVFSEAVFACTLAGVSAEKVEAEYLAYIRILHWPAFGLVVGTIVIFFIRRFKGIPIMLIAAVALALSPGWFDSSAAIGAACEPVGGFGTKVVLAVTIACFVTQLISLIVDYTRKNTS